MDFDEFLLSVSKIKNIPLPAEPSQFKMSPPFRLELLNRQKEAMKNAKKAAVLALFYPNSSRQTTVALILRNTYRGVHSGQIGFPGGKVESHDSTLEAAALRETQEEIGVPTKEVEILKRLTEVYIPPSNFFVQPFMGISRNTPIFTRQEEEVKAVIEVPLERFFDERIVVSKIVSTSYKSDVEVPAFDIDGHVVWGATAMILSEIKDLLKFLL